MERLFPNAKVMDTLIQFQLRVINAGCGPAVAVVVERLLSSCTELLIRLTLYFLTQLIVKLKFQFSYEELFYQSNNFYGRFYGHPPIA